MVYFFFEPNTQQVKIGFTTGELTTRLTGLRTACPDGYFITSIAGYRGKEEELHRRFKKHRVYKKREWFYYRDEVKEYIEQVKKERQKGEPDWFISLYESHRKCIENGNKELSKLYWMTYLNNNAEVLDLTDWELNFVRDIYKRYLSPILDGLDAPRLNNGPSQKQLDKLQGIFNQRVKNVRTTSKKNNVCVRMGETGLNAKRTKTA